MVNESQQLVSSNGESFRGKRFSQHNLERLKQLNAKQEHFKNSIKERGKYKADQHALYVSSRQEFESFLKKAREASNTYDVKHESRIRKALKHATNFAASANTIMEDMGPILNLLEHIGAPYGGTAIGIISFVFVIAKNRAKMEEQIGATFASIRDRLPGIRVYEHIYNENHELDKELQSKIVDAYGSFINFCMSAFEFYTQGGFRRWLGALHSNTYIDQEGARVQAAIVEMRLTCEDLLNKNVDTVKNEIKEVKAINNDLKRRLSELQDNNDKNRLDKASQLLGVTPIPDDDRHFNLSKHQANVAAEFSKENWYTGGTIEERVQAVERNQAYDEWLHSPQSRVLILSGANDTIGARHCWVSPIGFGLIDRFVSSESLREFNPCAFYLLGLRDEEDTWPDVLAFLIYRLLELNKEALRNEDQCRQLWGHLGSYAKKRRLPDTSKEEVRAKVDSTVDELRKIAVRVLDIFGTGKTTWIVLDRVDRCGVMPGEDTKVRHRGGRSLLRTMIRVAEEASVTVKILAVVNRADWHIEDEVYELRSRQESLVALTCHQSGEDYCS